MRALRPDVGASPSAPLEATDPALRSRLGHVKRLLERYRGDPRFRERLAAGDGAAAAHELGIAVDPEDVRCLWDGEREGEANGETVALFRRFQEWRGGASAEEVSRAPAPERRRFRAWRDAQIARCDLQLSRRENRSIFHGTVAFELSVGCSVGCWFCGPRAGKLSGHFLHTPPNRDLWSETLEVARTVCGAASARSGFCYWATDPLDNPDYESFCADFFDVVGAYPSTTTALALKDRARTHRLIAESERLGCFNNRLSILTLPMLNLLHREFSPEELLFVDLVLQNAEALSYKYVDGRFRDAAAKDPMLISREVAKMRYVYDAPEEDLALPTTTACVSGFLVNMLERRVQLISPCPSSDRWPFGCIVFEEGRFETAAELERLLDGMVDRHMTTGAPRNRPARLLPELRYEELPDGFRVTSRTEEVAFESRPLSDFMKALGAELRAGAKTPRALAEWAEETLAVPAADALQAVDEVWKAGALAPVDERDGSDGGPVARISTVRRAPPGAAGRPSTSEACRTTL